MPILADLVQVVIGVDTHKHTHTAAVLTAATGQILATHTVPTTPAGYETLRTLADQHPGPRIWAIEGTGGYGAGLVQLLAAHDEWVVELDRPARPARRHGAKSDALDAVRAAREALGRDRLAQPRAGGRRAALVVLLAARRSAVDAATCAQQQLQAMVVTAPPRLRAQVGGRSTRQLITACARLRGHPSWEVERRTTALVLRALARRVLKLEAKAHLHQQAITSITRGWRPDLLAELGVGPITAATVLGAWSHPGRCRSEAAFAMLGGAAPIPASSGQTVRVRLNRSGDRQLNRALHVVVLTRLRHDPATQAYAKRRRAQGKTDPEIKRCLKRYVARQLYRLLEADPALDTTQERPAQTLLDRREQKMGSYLLNSRCRFDLAKGPACPHPWDLPCIAYSPGHVTEVTSGRKPCTAPRRAVRAWAVIVAPPPELRPPGAGP